MGARGQWLPRQTPPLGPRLIGCPTEVRGLLFIVFLNPPKAPAETLSEEKNRALRKPLAPASEPRSAGVWA